MVASHYGAVAATCKAIHTHKYTLQLVYTCTARITEHFQVCHYWRQTLGARGEISPYKGIISSTCDGLSTDAAHRYGSSCLLDGATRILIGSLTSTSQGYPRVRLWSNTVLMNKLSWSSLPHQSTKAMKPRNKGRAGGPRINDVRKLVRGWRSRTCMPDQKPWYFYNNYCKKMKPVICPLWPLMMWGFNQFEGLGWWPHCMNYNSGACIILVLGYVPLAPNSLCEVRCQSVIIIAISAW